MGTIDDWYQNRSHRGDLNPRRDFENDDTHDRLQFGELPQREWLAPPDRSRDHLQPRATPANKKARPAKGPAKRRVKPASAMPRWEAFIRRWLAQNPGRSSTECRDAARAAGFPNVGKKTVAAVRRAIAEDALRHQERLRERQRRAELAADARDRASAASIRRRREAARRDVQKAAEAIARKKAREREQANSSIQKRQNGQKPTNRVKPLRPPLNTDRLGTPSRDYGPRCPACDMVPDGPTGLCRCS